nr:glycoside hydrolase family 9 protein [uncultured Sphaerochaeta sp.]
MKILVNHLGYSVSGYKKVLIACEKVETPSHFTLVDENDKVAFMGDLRHIGAVARWETGEYYLGEFSDFATEGKYRIRVGHVVSESFAIDSFLLTMRMINATAYYFKAQRSSGEWLHEDRNLPFKGGREGTVDAHGGWYDATGDYGIHFSHLSHSTYYNPQQMPFSAYAFFRTYENLGSNGNEFYTMIRRRLLDEGFWGADFLVRMQAPSGTFFRSINRSGALDAVQGTRFIGFEYHGSSSQFSEEAATAKDETVTDEFYETSFRSGGGSAIAALAIASRHYYPSREYRQEDYIRCAAKAWFHLIKNNEKYTNDGKWNLVDEYCALLAAIELYKTTEEYTFLGSAREMAQRMYARTVPVGEGLRRLEVVEGEPYFHASDEGLPVIALLHYAEIEPDQERRSEAVGYAEEIMRWKIEITDSLPNPFGYPRFEQEVNGTMVAKFFFPHETTVSPWWQGDNARIASLASAAKELSEVSQDDKLVQRCQKLAQDTLDWIMGLNPFDSCMIEGYGRNNIQYFFKKRYDFMNCPGGIVNGITSGLHDEEGIAYVSTPTDEVDDNWRWAEQWIPHVSWFLYAMGLRQE